MTTARTTTDLASGCRSLCAVAEAEDRVVMAGGRHSGRPGVLIRTAATHQSHHIVRLSCGTVARISTAHVHRAGCPLSG